MCMTINGMRSSFATLCGDLEKFYIKVFSYRERIFIYQKNCDNEQLTKREVLAGIASKISLMMMWILLKMKTGFFVNFKTFFNW